MKNDIVFEKQLKQATGTICLQNWLSLEQQTSGYTHTFSPDFEQKITILLHSSSTGKERKKARNRVRFLLIGAIAALLAASTAMAHTDLYEWLGNLLVKFGDNNVSIAPEPYTDEELNSTSPVKIKEYPLRYVPEGYSRQEPSYHPDSSYHELYLDGKGNMIQYDQNIAALCSLSIIYDGSTREKISINGIDAWLISDEEINSIFFEDQEYLFTILSTEPPEELIKMAESLEIGE